MRHVKWLPKLSYVVFCLATLIYRADGVLAANGDTFWYDWGQRENNQNLEPVSRRFRTYVDTSQQTCYTDACWCCRTNNSYVKLAHYHLDTVYNSDLISTEKTRANTYLEYYSSWADNRTASAHAEYNCHGWALETSSVWLVDPATMFDHDYDEKSYDDAQVGDRVQHQYDHTSKITVINTICGIKVIAEVEQKCGRYGRYKTGPYEIADYGDPVKYWRKKT